MPATSFNPYQQKVVDFRKGFGVAMAAPGSGKTTVIVARLRGLLDEGTNPRHILSTTFTSEGAKEITKRANLPEELSKYDGYKTVTTFHSWALAFIKNEADALPIKVRRDFYGHPNPLCLPLDAARILAAIVRRIPSIEWKDAQGYISRCKRMGITPTQAALNAREEIEGYYVTAYKKYEDALAERGLLDFDSILIQTAMLLERREDVCGRHQYKYIQVDEAQDTDSVQWRIVKALSTKHGNVLAVGDENQGMYSWRGSESNLTQYFTAIFPTAVVMPLPVNYRSTGAIVNYCKEIAPIKNETVTSLSTPNELGVAPTFKLFTREDEEAQMVINSCTNMASSAILARTNRQLAAFEDECSNRNLRYKLLGKSGFWSQHEVKDAVAILGSVAAPSDANVLRMLTAKCDATKYLRKTDTRDMPSAITMLKQFQQYNPDAHGNTVLLHRLMPRFSSGESSQDDIIRGIGHMLHELRAECQGLAGKLAVDQIVRRFGLLSHYDVVEDDAEEKKNFDNDPRENIQKLIDNCARFESLEKVYDYTQRARKAMMARTNCLILSTIHQAKGKEWNDVFVVGVNNEMLPHIKGDLEEERRIFFVACSRAAKRLQVSANGVPSEFIKEKLPQTEEDAPAIELDPWAGFQLQG